jgi:hypothetical protein
MDKAKWMLTIEKACQNYILWTSIVMLLFILLSYFNIISMLITTFPKAEQILSYIMGGIAFFGMYNIIMCGVAGIGMLFTKETRRIGIVAIIAAVLFCVMIYKAGV